jgi:hypothetical protein
MFGTAALLDEPRYQDVPRPELDGGEARLEQLFHDFGIALALNVPSFGEGAWGFPLHYQPTRHLPLFQDIGDSPNRAGIPLEVTLTADDYDRPRQLRSPILFDDGSQLQLRMYSWTQEIFVVHVDDDAAGRDREVRIEVVGEDSLTVDSRPPFSRDRPFRHSLSASMATLDDLEGRRFYDAADHVRSIAALPVTIRGGRPTLEGILPLAEGARTAVVILSLAERGMVETMPRERRSVPWRYHVELNLQDRVR